MFFFRAAVHHLLTTFHDHVNHLSSHHLYIFSDIAFSEADIRECDASHCRGVLVFTSLLLRHIAPHAVLLRRSFSLWLGKISAHWRAKTIRMRQVVNLFGSLASGVPWTFLLNSILVLMCLASCSQPWDCAILGGDDLAVGQLLYAALDFSHVEKFRIFFVLPLPTVGIFQFHGRLHDRSGSFPHILKVAGKVLDRCFSPIKDIAIKELAEFRQSVAACPELL